MWEEKYSLIVCWIDKTLTSTYSRSDVFKIQRIKANRMNKLKQIFLWFYTPIDIIENILKRMNDDDALKLKSILMAMYVIYLVVAINYTN